MTISEQVWKAKSDALRAGRVPVIIKLSHKDYEQMREEVGSLSTYADNDTVKDSVKLWGLSIDPTSFPSHVITSTGVTFDLETPR